MAICVLVWQAAARAERPNWAFFTALFGLSPALSYQRWYRSDKPHLPALLRILWKAANTNARPAHLE
jgi:hypothetical protein